MSVATWQTGATVRVRGKRWRIEGVEEGDDCTALRLSEVGAAEARTLTILAPFDRPVALDRRASLRVVRPRRFLHEIDRALLDAQPFGSLTQLARTSVRVIPYQLEPAIAMLRHGVTRTLIADGVGLGKTIQAGIVLRELSASAESFRAIVLTPAGLREQWRDELARHFRLETACADSDWLRRMAVERPPDINPWSLPGIYVASHDFVKRPEALRALEHVEWHLLIVDEAHAATSGTERRAAIHGIACRALRVMLLTATPHAADQHEFAALCEIGRIHEDEPPAAYFARRRADVQPGEPRRTRIHAVRPTSPEVAMHRALERYSARVWQEAGARRDDRARLASIVLRKRALSSAGSLLISLQRRQDLLRGAIDAGTQQLLLPIGDEDPLEDDEPIDVLAAPGLSDVARERRWLSALIETADEACRNESKTRWLVRLLRRINEPVIVFTEYRDTLIRLLRVLESHGRSVAILHGGMDPRQRTSISSSLDRRTQVLLATDAAAEGLNLHHYSRTVIHYELPWSPSRLEQRAGRVDRFGQARRVHEVALVSSTRAERLVLEPLARRSASAHSGSCRSILDVLGESHVVEAVMSGTRLTLDRAESSASAPTSLVILDLQTEASSEAMRIAGHRVLSARSGSTHDRAHGTRPVATAMRSSDSSEGLVLVFRVEIVDQTGRNVHGELVAIKVGSSYERRVPRSRLLRALVLDTTTRNEGLAASLAAMANDTRTRLEPLVALLDRRLQQRRSAIRNASRGPSRRIVQLHFFGPRRQPDPERIEIAPAARPLCEIASTSSLAAAMLWLRGARRR